MLTLEYMETENNHTEYPDWKKILFVTLGIISLVLVFLWKWWLGVIYFLIICYGAKRVTYSLLIILFAFIAILGLVSIFL